MFNYQRDFYALNLRKQLYVFYILCFLYTFIGIFVSMDYQTCKNIFERRVTNIASFNQEFALKCGSYLVSKKDNWILNEDREIFIKDDLFYKIDDCRGEL